MKTCARKIDSTKLYWQQIGHLLLQFCIALMKPVAVGSQNRCTSWMHSARIRVLLYIESAEGCDKMHDLFAWCGDVGNCRIVGKSSTYANGGYQVPPLPEALAYKTSGIALKGRCKSWNCELKFSLAVVFMILSLQSALNLGSSCWHASHQ